MDFIQSALKSLNKTFSDNRLWQKAGIIFGINFVLYIVSLIVQAISFSTSLTSGSGIGEELDIAYLLASIVLPIFVQILTLPIWIYLKGYTYQIADNAKSTTIQPILPEHDNPKRSFSLGGLFLSISYTLTIPLVIASILPLLFIFNSSVNWLISTKIEIAVGVIAGIIFSSLMFGSILFLINQILVPCLMYIYMRKGSLAATFNILNVIEIIGISWKQWLIVILITIMINIILGILKFVLCCLGPIVIPSLQTFVIIANGILIGQVYRSLDQKIDI